MFPIPFLRLDSIPPTLPPPSGNVAAINSLNASADAGVGCAKTPFLGPGLSWVSAVLGSAVASGMVGSAGNGQGLLSTQSLGALPAALWISPAFNFQGTLSKSQHKTWLAGSSPGVSSICFPSSFFSLSSSFLTVLIFSLLCTWFLQHSCPCSRVSWRASSESTHSSQQ